MSSSVKQQWIDALRSGEFEQCRYALVRYKSSVDCVACPPENSSNAYFCALGVFRQFACEGKSLHQIWPVTYREKAMQIVFANDNQGLSFRAIAEMIESWPDDVEDPITNDVVAIIPDDDIELPPAEPVITEPTVKELCHV